MICRKCGTTIADKAIVCYKCGTATIEAKYKAPAESGPWLPTSLVSRALTLVLLALCVLYVQRLVTGGAPDALRWVIVVLAAGMVAFRLMRRRTRR
jgi:ribosomal protein L40E